MHVRVVYSGRILAMVYNDPDFCVYINKQTTRFLGFERLDVIVGRSMAILFEAHGALGPYFIEDNNDTPLIVTQKRYRNIVLMPFIDELNTEVSIGWTTSYTGHQSIAVLQDTSQGPIISLGTDFNYPSHSSDLIPPDAYLRGMLKEKVFSGVDQPRTVNALREKIV